MKVKAKSLSPVWLFATPWTVAYQAPPSMGFSRQEYWSGLPFPSPGDLPYPGIEPRSPAFQANALTSEPPGKPMENMICFQFFVDRLQSMNILWVGKVSLFNISLYLGNSQTFTGLKSAPYHKVSDGVVSSWTQKRVNPCLLTWTKRWNGGYKGTDASFACGTFKWDLPSC